MKGGFMGSIMEGSMGVNYGFGGYYGFLGFFRTELRFGAPMVCGGGLWGFRGVIMGLVIGVFRMELRFGAPWGFELQTNDRNEKVSSSMYTIIKRMH
jgi:hypothetical protein